MMDFTGVYEHFVGIVVLACLMIGYAIKHCSLLKRVSNDDIPIILAFLGACINMVVSGFSIESAVYGAIMGVISTGTHQLGKAFAKFIEGAISEDNE